jgi:hypothetical protein
LNGFRGDLANGDAGGVVIVEDLADLGVAGEVEALLVCVLRQRVSIGGGGIMLGVDVIKETRRVRVVF